MGDPQAIACRAARAQGDLRPTAAAVEQSRGAWDRRWFLLRGLEASVPRHLFDALVAAHPNNPVAYLLRGVHGVLWGWEARGSGWASAVTEEGWRLLRERCSMAVTDLAHAASLDPLDPTPFAWLLRAGLGLEWSMKDAESCFAEGQRRGPEHFDLYWRMLSWKLAKWHGSAEESLAFARAAAQGAPPGSLRHALVIRAHLEHCDDLARKDRSRLSEYWGRYDVRNELTYARAMSVGHSSHVRSMWSHQVHHDLAELYYLCGDRQLLQDELRAIGGAYDPLHFGPPPHGAEQLDRIRAWANAPSPQKKAQSAQNASQRRGVMWGLIGAGLLIAVSLVLSGVHSAKPYFSHRFFVVNPTDASVDVSIDGAAPRRHDPRQGLEYDLADGRHTIRVTRVDEAAAVVEEGSFDRPGRRFGLLGTCALYDITGAGRYVAARVPYDGTQNEVHGLGMRGQVVEFPEGTTTFRSYFPDEMRRGTVLEGVCLRGPDGRVPCLR